MNNEKDNNSLNINNLFSSLGQSTLFNPIKNYNIPTPSTELSKNKLVKDYSYKEDKNPKFRNSMEDFSDIKIEDDICLFCLYDGHGGIDTVRYVRDRLSDIVIKNLSTGLVKDALVNSFKKIDNELKFCDSDNTGTTACVTLICEENGNRIIYCANVGDTFCAVIGKTFRYITKEHRCSNKEEANRIVSCGGVISNGRIKGQLVLTRALGDQALRKYGVIPEPDVCRIEVDKDDKFVLIASDGVWDVLSDNDIIGFAKNIDNSNDLAKIIVSRALENGSKDNISCIVIMVN